ncbi:MAG: D-alanine--D-alanine ligase [Lachnospiraceae bacterium]|nr:D-alanine--D-alanine ligase [Lachnospiraceae bacterium]
MKKTVAVIFGGQSSEHDVSCVSGATVIRNIDGERYDTILIGITKDGRWLAVDSVESLENGSWKQGKTTAIVSPDRSRKGVLLIDGEKTTFRPVDVIFPVLHGLYGEDGTIQGLFALAGIPYVGCGVLCSAISMDKLYTKVVVDTLGIRQAKFVAVFGHELADMDACVARVEEALSYPVFVKPSNAGSSKGVNKAHDRKELVYALKEASYHDRKILVEETIVGREIECAVMGDGITVDASGVGEILAADEFYSYDAKYNNEESRTVIGPELPEGKEEEFRDCARRIFRALDGFGLSRVDFFLEKGTDEVVFNEINTLPGFTSISMYPMLWGAKGIDKKTLITKLIELAPLRK